MVSALYWYRAHYVRAVDGDTVQLDVDMGFRVTRRMTIRLLGVNAPEKVGASRLDGYAAQTYLEQLLEPTRDTGGLMLHSHLDRADKYGDRWLGTLWADSVNVCQRMVEAGHAVPYTP